MAHATRSTLIGTASCLALAACLVGGASSATAAGIPVATTPAQGVVQYAISAADVASAGTSWTPQRMAAAVSVDFVDPDPVGGDIPAASTASELEASAATADTLRASASVVTESTPVPGFTAVQHLGAVFFRSGGTDYRCTGNAVVSASGDLVATAGRCISAAKDVISSDVVFVPQYTGTGADSVWPVDLITTKPQWVHSRKVDFDAAYLRVQAPAGSPAGTTLSSTHGASGMRFDSMEDGDDVRTTGYPTDGGHDGRTVVTVTGESEPNPWMNEDYAIEGMGIESHAGISGSPVFPDDVQDVQVGLLTFGYQKFPHDAFGPQLTGSMHKLYRIAAAS